MIEPAAIQRKALRSYKNDCGIRWDANLFKIV